MASFTATRYPCLSLCCWASFLAFSSSASAGWGLASGDCSHSLIASFTAWLAVIPSRLALAFSAAYSFSSMFLRKTFLPILIIMFIVII